MLFFEKLFEPFFDNDRITDARIYNFCNYTLIRMRTGNGTGIYSDFIAILDKPTQAMYLAISSLDTGTNIQIGKTKTNDQVLAAFKAKMSDEQSIIAKSLGGKNKPEFLEFYPHKGTEYSKATKEQMPILVKRVADAATKYETKIGKTLANELRQLQTDWNNSRDSQTTQIAAVGDQKVIKSKTRIELEDAIKLVLLELAKLFMDKPGLYKQFIKPSLLYPSGKNVKSVNYNGTTDPEAVSVVFHDNISDDAEISIKITSIDTEAILYIGESPTEKPTAVGKLFRPSKKFSHLTAIELGTEGGYLLLYNPSKTDKVVWEIKVR